MNKKAFIFDLDAESLTTARCNFPYVKIANELHIDFTLDNCYKAS
jgi:hypothetical protein